jgi:hypothetical protein
LFVFGERRFGRQTTLERPIHAQRQGGGDSDQGCARPVQARAADQGDQGDQVDRADHRPYAERQAGLAEGHEHRLERHGQYADGGGRHLPVHDRGAGGERLAHDQGQDVVAEQDRDQQQHAGHAAADQADLARQLAHGFLAAGGAHLGQFRIERRDQQLGGLGHAVGHLAAHSPHRGLGRTQHRTDHQGDHLAEGRVDRAAEIGRPGEAPDARQSLGQRTPEGEALEQFPAIEVPEGHAVDIHEGGDRAGRPGGQISFDRGVQREAQGAADQAHGRADRLLGGEEPEAVEQAQQSHRGRRVHHGDRQGVAGGGRRQLGRPAQEVAEQQGADHPQGHAHDRAEAVE